VLIFQSYSRDTGSRTRRS